MGGGAAAGYGEAQGGTAGMLKEVGLYLTQAGLTYVAAKAIAKKADGGPIIPQLGATGLLSAGTHGRADDVLIRPDVLASKGEYVVNKEATAKNLSLLNYINNTRKKFADGGPTGSDFGGAPSGPDPSFNVKSIEKAIKSGGFDTGNIKGISPSASQEQKALMMTDNLLIGSTLSFVEGWLQGGDQYTGIPTGIGQVIRFLVGAGATSLAAKAGTKSGVFKERADGGIFVPETKGVEAIKEYPKFMTATVNALSGGDNCPGCKSRLGNFNRGMKRRFKFADGGTINKSDMTGSVDEATAFSLGGCFDLLSNPAKLISQFWDGMIGAMRAPVLPLARDMVSEDMFPNISSNRIQNDITEIYKSLDPSNFLGDCWPFAKGGIVTAPTFFAHGGGMGVAGENGPEAIMPLQRDSQGNLGVSGGGGGINVTFNIDGNVLGNETALREFAEEVGHQLITLRGDNRVPSLA
jgi:hypothetical protein